MLTAVSVLAFPRPLIHRTAPGELMGCLNPDIHGPSGKFSAANSKPQLLKNCYILFQRFDSCHWQKVMQVIEQREVLVSLAKHSYTLFFHSSTLLQCPVSQFGKPMRSLIWFLKIKQNHICCQLNKKK